MNNSATTDFRVDPKKPKKNTSRRIESIIGTGKFFENIFFSAEVVSNVSFHSVETEIKIVEQPKTIKKIKKIKLKINPENSDFDNFEELKTSNRYCNIYPQTKKKFLSVKNKKICMRQNPEKLDSSICCSLITICFRSYKQLHISMILL